MAIKVTFDRKLVLNGKEFNSIDELPENVRQVCKNAVSDLSGAPGHGSVIKTDIIFNGKQYTSIDAMPQDARVVYRQALKAAGLDQPGDGFTGGKGVHLKGNRNRGSDLQLNVSTTAIVPGSHLPKGLGWAIAGGLVLFLLLMSGIYLF
jgi:hypothetical protein